MHDFTPFSGLAGGAQRLDLLLEPAEDAGVAGFQPHHPHTGRGIVDQQPADMVLPRRQPAGALADRDEIGAGAREIEDRTRGEVVIEHDVGLAQPRGPLHGQEVGIAGTGRDEGDETAHRSSAIRWKNVPVAWPRRDPVSATTVPVASRTTASGVSGCEMIVE